MESPAARLLELLSLLQSRPRWTATELAERLAITTRTVRRDIGRLRELGYPVDAELGSTGGYQLGSGGALPPLLLTDDEAVAVAVGLRAAATGGVAGYDEAAVSALTKLEQVLPTRLREAVRALSAASMVGRTGGPVVDSDVLLTVARSCRWQERLHFRYRDASGNETERRVEPHGVVNASRRWYLVARDLDRTDWRTFRLDRVVAPRLTGHRFVPDDSVDATAMVLDGLTLAVYDYQAEVLLAADPDDVALEVAPTIGTIEPVEGGTLLRLGANTLEWIARYVASLPFDAEVRDPPELRAALRDLARRLTDANQ